MKALSIRQPWAWLIVNGYKDVENRNWKSSYRGTLLIHTGKTPDDIWREHFKEYINPQSFTKMMEAWETMPLGGIVGMVRMVDCVTECSSKWFVGEYGFLFDRQNRLEFKPMKGQLGIFDCIL